MTAAIIGTNISYIFLTFLPPVVWLLFYLREDRHPEPKFFLMLVFIGGVASAIIAVIVELVLIGQEGIFSGSIGMAKNAYVFFLVIGLVEEYVKYLPIKFLVLRKSAFDEPVDAMIYMMTSAMGFAALENALFILPIFHQNIFSGLEIVANRFLGANLLHVLSSGIVGFFLARAFFSPKRRHFIALGVLLAAILHAGFNYLILVREAVPQGTFYIILLLSTMAVMVFMDFERLKKTRIINKSTSEF